MCERFSELLFRRGVVSGVELTRRGGVPGLLLNLGDLGTSCCMAAEMIRRLYMLSDDVVSDCNASCLAYSQILTVACSAILPMMKNALALLDSSSVSINSVSTKLSISNPPK